MMERNLKERIIGAGVLVVFVVLVVPVFLDGSPQDGEMVSERVPLPGQSEEQKSQTIVLERDREEPVPVATSSEPVQAAPAREEPQEESPEEPAPTQVTTPEPDPEPPPPAAGDTTDSSTKMWAVQLGSFSNQQNAENLVAELHKQDFAAFLSQVNTASGTLHRVRIGPQKDRDTAEAMAARLKRAGHAGQVVPHP